MMSFSISDGTNFPLLRLKKPLYEIQNLDSTSDGVVSSISSTSIACRVKYLVDTPEIIQRYLDKSLFLESATRFMTAKYVHSSLDKKENYYDDDLNNHWNIIAQSFQFEISKRSREKLLLLDLSVDVYADALAAIMFIDRLPVLDLFLDSRMSCILQNKAACSVDNLSHVISVLCHNSNIVQLTLAQVGQLFLQLSPHMVPLLKKTLLTSLNSPASHLFSGIPNPDFEIVSWNSFRVTLIGLFDQTKHFCVQWFDDCGRRMLSDVVNGDIYGEYLIDAFENAQQISLAEDKIRATLQDNQVLEGSLEWLNSVSASKVISPWKTVSELVLGCHLDIWMEFFEYAFIGRMESIIESRFDELRKLLNVKEWIDDIAEAIDNETDYPGNEANRISSLVHSLFEDVLEDILIFFESPNASLRRDDLAPCFQSHCFGIMYSILLGLGVEMERLYYDETGFVMPRDVAVHRLLSIHRLLFAFQKHSERITMILGSPKLWVTKARAHIPSNSSVDSPKFGRAGHVGASLKEQTSLLDSVGVSDSSSSELEFLNWKPKDLFSEACDLWMFWVAEKLSTDLYHNLKQDDNLSATTSLRGWEETVGKQEQSDENTSEIKISLPSMPSEYITLFLNQACGEIRRAGGHVLDRRILENFASTCLEKVIGIYGDFVSNEKVFDSRVSKKGVLQILFDIGFSANILSGGDFIRKEDVSGAPKLETSDRKRQDESQTKKAICQERIDGLINGLAQRLDPLDWLTYEPYLWENERQWYLRHAADFVFFVQPGCRMYSEVVRYEDLATN